MAILANCRPQFVPRTSSNITNKTRRILFLMRGEVGTSLPLAPAVILPSSPPLETFVRFCYARRPQLWSEHMHQISYDPEGWTMAGHERRQVIEQSVGPGLHLIVVVVQRGGH